jgi:hypothetical protein
MAAYVTFARGLAGIGYYLLAQATLEIPFGLFL